MGLQPPYCFSVEPWTASAFANVSALKHLVSFFPQVEWGGVQKIESKFVNYIEAPINHLLWNPTSLEQISMTFSCSSLLRSKSCGRCDAGRRTGNWLVKGRRRRRKTEKRCIRIQPTGLILKLSVDFFKRHICFSNKFLDRK